MNKPRKWLNKQSIRETWDIFCAVIGFLIVMLLISFACNVFLPSIRTFMCFFLLC